MLDAAMVCAPSHDLAGQHVPLSIEAGETVWLRVLLLLAQPETNRAAAAKTAQQVMTRFSFRDMISIPFPPHGRACFSGCIGARRMRKCITRADNDARFIRSN
ncbi:MAG: hypothetical protein EA380_03275 [Phycisphaeraceae bacterium]|nr:MAG: hypothetical protein EA380_03275 [Phycisphaeraceae bacterium]